MTSIGATRLEDSDGDHSGRSCIKASMVALGLFALALLGFVGSSGANPHACPRVPSCQSADLAAAGVVVGTVRIPPLPPTAGPPRLSPYSRQRYRAPQPTAVAAGVGDVVVYVSTAPSDPGGGPLTPATIYQQDLTISPHVTAVSVGSEVDFPNGDDVYHNLFSLSATRRFNLGRYPPGESRSVSFEKAGLVRLFCDIHSDMAAVILVLDNGYFTRPDADGNYRIERLPPGQHTIVAWHETLPADSMVVTVSEGGTSRADLSLGR